VQQTARRDGAQSADVSGPQQMELSRKGKHLIYQLTYPPHSDT